jgi:cytochrome P450 family 628
VLFIHQLEKAVGHVVNLKTWSLYYTFDIMGALAFGRSFGFTAGLDYNKTEAGDAPALIAQGMSMLRFFTPIPWLAHIVHSFAPYVPILSKKWNEAVNWASDACEERIQRETRKNTEPSSAKNRVDAFTRFIASAVRDADSSSLNRDSLCGDAFSFTVAGSHSTAATLTVICYELSRDPSLQRELRAEVMDVGVMERTRQGAEIEKVLNIDSLRHLRLLDACINEALRLYPVVPTGGIRQTVDTGLKIGETWIPPRTIIVTPRWTIGRRKFVCRIGGR